MKAGRTLLTRALPGMALLLWACLGDRGSLAGGAEVGNPELAGSVVDGEGRPVRGARVSLVPRDLIPLAADTAIRLDTTDAKGRWSFRSYRAGVAYHLIAQADGNRAVLAEITIPATGKPADAGDIRLAQAGGLEGLLRLADGTPAVGIDIAVQGTSATAKSDTAGRFRIEGLPKGTYPLHYGYAGSEGRHYLGMATVDSGALTPFTGLVGDSLADPGDVFDGFAGPTVETTRWRTAKRRWGQASGGVVPENVRSGPGMLLLRAHGDAYPGPVRGVDPAGDPVDRTTRVGAAIASREYLGSGRYEVRMRVPAMPGAAIGFWTDHYVEVREGDSAYAAGVAAEPRRVQGNDALGRWFAINHEIDFLLPQDSSAPGTARLESMVGELAFERSGRTAPLGFAAGDGRFHTFRFDWHTGDSAGTVTPRVEFYVDGNLLHTSTEPIPVRKGRLWLGISFPDGLAGMAAPYRSAEVEINWVRFLPFQEAGDRSVPESYPEAGWSGP